MIELTMTEADIGIGDAPNGMKCIAATDRRSGIRVIIPLDDQAAKAVALKLSSGLILATKVPGNGGDR